MEVFFSSSRRAHVLLTATSRGLLELRGSVSSRTCSRALFIINSILCFFCTRRLGVRLGTRLRDCIIWRGNVGCSRYLMDGDGHSVQKCLKTVFLKIIQWRLYFSKFKHELSRCKCNIIYVSRLNQYSAIFFSKSLSHDIFCKKMLAEWNFTKIQNIFE